MRKTPRHIKKLIRRIKYWRKKLNTVLAQKPPQRRKKTKKRRKIKPFRLQISELLPKPKLKKRRKIKKRISTKFWWQKLLGKLFFKPQPKHQVKRRVRRRKPLYR